MGLFEWLRMPFGICSAPHVYSRFIQSVLNPLGSRGLAAYLDDILLFHDNLVDHLHRLEEVLAVHQQAGIKIKPSKTDQQIIRGYIGGRARNLETARILSKQIKAK